MEPDHKRTYLKLFNSESREKEKMINHGARLSIYTCGPTVYDYAHIGNFRTYVFEDLLRKTLKFMGFHIKQVMNITDVDDKTIRGANAAGKSLSEFTQTYIDAFFEDIDSLCIEKAEVYPYATDHIPEMIAMIERLIDEGAAYIGKDKSVYFKIESFPSYGRLSHFCLDDLKQNASLHNDADEYEKENASDFVLWKAYDESRDGPIFWESPFGKGRPGWHIECSAMAIKHLGETLDIHVGGVDNKFPHHENEIAQSEACTQKCFAKHWLHSEHLLVEGKKMSKSLGNFYTLRNLLQKGFSGKEVRLALLQTHYRVQLNFTMEGLEGARNSLKRINAFVFRLKNIESGETGLEYRDSLVSAFNQFKVALADDLNIAEALAALFNLIRDMNGLIDQGKIGEKAAQEIISTLVEMDKILSIITFEQSELIIPSDVQKAFEMRQQARSKKDYAQADHFRELIESRGYIIEDAPTGSFL
ncbi:MAG: cysteine--tRNA ligase, partial [Rhabdochlamydiaceae bacterium]|nr:cysteine--tRNA ligase [Candidatus Amphrikana amoebophyrae]